MRRGQMHNTEKASEIESAARKNWAHIQMFISKYQEPQIKKTMMDTHIKKKQSKHNIKYGQQIMREDSKRGREVKIPKIAIQKNQENDKKYILTHNYTECKWIKWCN